MSIYEFDILSRAAAPKTPGDAWTIPHALSIRPFLARGMDRLTEAKDYDPSPGLRDALNVAIAAGRPLLVTGEPGTGKTMAAYFVASRLGLGNPIRFQVRSDSRARDLLYEWDAVARLNAGGEVPPLEGGTSPERDFPFVKPGALWRAFRGQDQQPTVLLIDEIDKAPRDFPNDLLLELEEFRFTVDEYPPPENAVVCPRERIPITIITSNSERRLPEPFLRRCIYHNIDMMPDQIERVVTKRIGQLEATELRAPFLGDALECLHKVREDRSLDKRPTVDEFWTWLGTLDGPDAAGGRAMVIEVAGKIRNNELVNLAVDLPNPGCLIKTDNDRQRMGAT